MKAKSLREWLQIALLLVLLFYVGVSSGLGTADWWITSGHRSPVRSRKQYSRKHQSTTRRCWSTSRPSWRLPPFRPGQLLLRQDNRLLQMLERLDTLLVERRVMLQVLEVLEDELQLAQQALEDAGLEVPHSDLWRQSLRGPKAKPNSDHGSQSARSLIAVKSYCLRRLGSQTLVAEGFS